MSERAVPILPSRDLAETRRFYEPLGFVRAYEDAAYLILERGGATLHFFHAPDVDPLTTSAGCYLYVDDADALHADWERLIEPDPATGSRVVPPVDTDYGLREFAVVDRSGNLVRVGSSA